MSVREKTSKALQATVINKLVGIIVDGTLLAAVVAWGVLSGSFAIVWEFASEHPHACDRAHRRPARRHRGRAARARGGYSGP